MKKDSKSHAHKPGTVSSEEFRELQERYSFIVNAHGEMMTLINRAYIYELVNDSWCRTFGKSREDFIGKSVSEIWGDRKFESEIKSKIDQCLLGEIFTEEDSFVIAGGEMRYYEVNYFPYRSKGQGFTHAVGVTRDITERKEAEIALKKSEHQLRELNEQKDQYLSIINSDLDQASNYVNSLLPDELHIPHLKINWKIVPSAKLGGDSFGYHWIDNEHFAIYMLDVTGHGVGAALHSVSALNMLKFETLPDTDFKKPDEVLHALNQVFQMSEHHSSFITMWYLVYNQSSRVLTYAGAGHPPLIIFNSEGIPVTIPSENMMVGVDEGLVFRTGTYKIEGKTEAYIYTDGAYEAELPDGKMLDVKDLVDFLLKNRDSSAQEIDLLYNSLVKLREGQNLEDDFTIIKIYYDG